MTNHGDDCYFFYYSSCSKGDSCPFRHCEAAIGNETVCNLWEEGRCFRPICKFRHMKITHNRKEIACYWENQPAGCQKPHCAFYHEKPRCVDGIYVPPDKVLNRSEEVPQEEPVLSQPTLPPATNPQVRGVKKSESQEPVPSPTHPPVVINPADDDEDEDDQFSEEGEVGVSPRKQPGGAKAVESMNFGVSTLEEIRLRRALKASMKRALYSFPGADTSTNGGKENIKSSFKQMRDDFRDGDGVPLKRTLAERLGRIVDEEQPTVPTQKSSKSVKQRLTLPSDPIAATPSVELRPKKPEQIKIKTLEEIKLEKAAKSHNPKESSASEIAINQTITTKNPKGVKRAITVKDNSIGNVRTFSEILHEKKKRQEDNQKQDKNLQEKSKDKSQDKAETIGSLAKESAVKIRVKTLEEIRQEKAARLQAQEETPQAMTTDPQETSAKKPRLLRFKKDASQTKTQSSDKDISPKTEIVTEKPEKLLKSTPTPPESSSNSIKVKTFEEIMREKRLRKNDTVEPDSPSSHIKNSAPVDPPALQLAASAVKRKGPVKITLNADSSPTSDSGVHQAKTRPAPVTSAPVKNGGALTMETSKTVTPDKQTQETGTDTKVRPKLNVKPSVVKPSVHLKPGQKRKAPSRSAVAAVKPLTSTSKEPETACKDSHVFPSVSLDSAQSSDFRCNTVSSSDSACNPQELLAPDTSAVTPSRKEAKSRRTSATVSRLSSITTPTSAVDDFNEFISELTTDDPLEDTVDPGLGEDWLQELSDMIDS